MRQEEGGEEEEEKEEEEEEECSDAARRFPRRAFSIFRSWAVESLESFRQLSRCLLMRCSAL